MVCQTTKVNSCPLCWVSMAWTKQQAEPNFWQRWVNRPSLTAACFAIELSALTRSTSTLPAMDATGLEAPGTWKTPSTWCRRQTRTKSAWFPSTRTGMAIAWSTPSPGRWLGGSCSITHSGWTWCAICVTTWSATRSCSRTLWTWMSGRTSSASATPTSSPRRGSWQVWGTFTSSAWPTFSSAPSFSSTILRASRAQETTRVS